MNKQNTCTVYPKGINTKYAVEAACKVIIKQRMCNSGMRWTEDGVKNILVLRCFNETDGKWKQFWDKITKMGY